MAERNDDARLFVGGLNFDTTEDILRDAFSKYGDVVESKVGFVNGVGRRRFVDETHAQDARSLLMLEEKGLACL